jgi:sec-independent protein translocase protein TatA
MSYPLASLFGEYQWVLIALAALLLFGGKRLPEMGRSLGRGIVEFKKGLHGIGDEIDEASRATPSSASKAQLPNSTIQAALDAGYKFDPYTGKPLQKDPVTGQPMRFDPYTGKPLTQETASAGPSNTIGA